MMRVLEALRQNPDAAALAVLCLVLGIGRQGIAARPIPAFCYSTVGIHWVCARPPAAALHDLRSQLRGLAHDALAALPAPARRY
jgi:hypothetical protein